MRATTEPPDYDATADDRRQDPCNGARRQEGLLPRLGLEARPYEDGLASAYGGREKGNRPVRVCPDESRPEADGENALAQRESVPREPKPNEEDTV